MQTKSSVNIGIRRAYVPPERQDGYRALVDRLWPRGISKSDACIDEWWQEGAPSTDLRKWFSHDPEKWAEFKRRYIDELKANREEVTRFVDRAGFGPITLVYGAKDEQHNHAIVLKEFIETLILHNR